MKTITRTTSAGIVKDYAVTIQQFESIDEAKAAWREKGLNADDVLLGIVNKAQEQNAMQGPKSGILEAVSKVREALAKERGIKESDVPTGDILSHADVVKAVAAAQETTSKYILGAPRATGGTGPVTRKEERETIDALRNKGAEMSDEDMVRTYLRLGLPIPSALKKLAERIQREGAPA